MSSKYIVLIYFCLSAKWTLQHTLEGAVKDQLEMEIEEYQKIALEILEENHTNSEREDMKLSSIQNNICTNGKDSSKLSPQQYLSEFAKGPCSPVVALPGILGSKLVVKIDCEKLMKSDYDTFRSCTWSTCTGSSTTRPKEEYVIWVPPGQSPMSITKPFGNSKRCFSGLFSFATQGQGASVKLKDKDGVTIHTLGSTPLLGNSATDNNCGFSAIESMAPGNIKPKGESYYSTFRTVMLKAGYKMGITLQALPYDFRKDLRENKLKLKFPRVINEMNEMTGKKVSIVAHSFGNLQTMNYLWGLSQKEKDMKIARYIGLAPPLGGAIKPMVTAFGKDSDFSFQIGPARFGLHSEFFDHAAYQLRGLYNLYPSGAFAAHRSKPFMKAMLSRIESERTGKAQAKGTIMDIFPPINSDCVVGFNGRSDKCLLGLTDFSEFGEVMGEKITNANLVDMLKKYGYNSDAWAIYQQSIDKRFTELKNPGVQTNIIYVSTLPTEKKIHYKSDPKTKTSKGQMYDPDSVEKELGDGAVLTSSALVAGIKWADEFNRRSVSGAKPVTFTEVCSTYNRKASIFQSGKSVQKNEYMGVACECAGTKSRRVDPAKCSSHLHIVSDPKVVEFVVNSVIDGQKGTVGKRFQAMGDVDLSAYENNCKMFNGI